MTELLAVLATIVTPDAILRWHRQLSANEHTHASKAKCIGRPGLMQAIREHIVRMAKDNARWGHARLQGELRKLGHDVARSTLHASRLSTATRS